MFLDVAGNSMFVKAGEVKEMTYMKDKSAIYHVEFTEPKYFILTEHNVHMTIKRYNIRL